MEPLEIEMAYSLRQSVTDQLGANWICAKKLSDLNRNDREFALLIDIAESLRAIRRQMECHNVSAGFVAMQEMRDIVKRRLPAKKRAKKPAKRK